MSLYYLDKTNWRYIFEKHVSFNLTYERLKKLCLMCWYDRYGFICKILNLTFFKNGYYRKRFDKYMSGMTALGASR